MTTNQIPFPDHQTHSIDQPVGQESGWHQPRTPLAVRLLLVVIGMLVAAMSPAVVLLIPGISAAIRNGPLHIAALIQMGSWLLALPVYIAVAGLLTRRIDRRPLAESGWVFNRRSPLALLAGAAAGAAVVVGAVVILLPTGAIVSAEPIGASWGLMLALLAIRAFVLQGIGEELLWRGYVLQTMRQHPMRALLVSTLVFGTMHLVSGGGQQSVAEHFWYLAMPIGFAFLAGTLALRVRSLWVAIGVHGGFHVGTLIVTALGWSIQGPLVWVTIGVVYLLAGLLVLALTPRRLLAAGSEISPFDK